MNTNASLAGAAVLAAALGVPGKSQEATPAPEERGVLVHEEGAFEGYTLFGPLSSRSVVLVDMEGEIVHAWESDLGPAGGVYLLENGHLLRCERREDNPRFRGGGIGGRLREYDWDGNVVWTFDLADDYQAMHHDVEVLPNGNVLAIVWEHRFREDAIAAGRDPESIGEAGMWPDAVIEIRPTRPEGGEIVWEWHAWDHLIQDFDAERENHGTVAGRHGRIDVNFDHRDEPPMTAEERERREEVEKQMRALGYVGSPDDDGGDGDDERDRHGELPDWLHTNAVAYEARYDLIALSSPHLNEILVIDHSTTTEEAAWSTGGRWGKGGDVLYRWGNPRNYGAGDPDDQQLFYQHDPKWIQGDKPDELRLLIFNNGRGRPGKEHSSAVEIVLPFDPQKGFTREPSQAFGPDEPAWTFAGDGSLFAPFISGAQRLPNGNTLLCFGTTGHLVEVTPAGEVVWELLNPFTGAGATEDGAEVDATALSAAPATTVAPPVPPNALFRATRLAPDHPGLARLR